MTLCAFSCWLAISAQVKLIWKPSQELQSQQECHPELSPVSASIHTGKHADKFGRFLIHICHTPGKPASWDAIIFSAQMLFYCKHSTSTEEASAVSRCFCTALLPRPHFINGLFCIFSRYPADCLSAEVALSSPAIHFLAPLSRNGHRRVPHPLLCCTWVLGGNV